jgi:phosphatidylglycerol lysyltransferase
MTEATSPARRRRRMLGLVGPAVAFAIILLALMVLRRVTTHLTLAQISAALAEVPNSRVVASLGFTACAMLTMAAYDVLSCRLTGVTHVSRRLAAMAGFAGYAVSNMLGFHIILGGSLRYRLYRAAGLTPREIARILAMSLGTIWLAIGSLAAVIFLVAPASLPNFAPGSPLVTRVVGLVLGVALVALIASLWKGGRVIRVFGWDFPLPHGPGALQQIALGLADFTLASAALYVLLPADLRPEFPALVLIFTSSLIAGSLSHSPGGLGVLEAGVLLGLGAMNRPDAVAALMVFRLTYFLMPFIVAMLLVFGHEAQSGLVRTRLGRILLAIGALAVIAALGLIVGLF